MKPQDAPKKRVIVELREGYVNLAVTHADYHQLMDLLRNVASIPNGPFTGIAEYLIPVLRVEGLEPTPTTE